MKRWNCILGLAIAACWLPLANAGKPDKPGDGKDEPGPSPVIELSTEQGGVWDINNEQVDGIEAVGRIQSTAGGEAPYYWKINLKGEVDSVSLATNAPEGLDASLTQAAGLNNHGTIVGWASNEVASDLHVWPLLWKDCMAIPAVLPMPNGYRGLAGSINDDGIVLGQIWKRSEDWRDYSESWIVAWKVDLNGADPIIQDRIEFLPDTERCRLRQAHDRFVGQRVSMGVVPIRDATDGMTENLDR